MGICGKIYVQERVLRIIAHCTTNSDLSNSLSKEIVGDGPLDVPFYRDLQCGFGASRAPPPTNAILKQSDKLELYFSREVRK